MPPKYTSEILKAEIKALEIRQAEEGKLLKAQMVVTYKSLNPVLLVADAFKELTTSPKLKESIVETLVGMGSGFLAKRMIFGKTNNRFLRFAGLLVEQGINNMVSRNLDLIRNALIHIMQRFGSETGPKQPSGH